MWRSALLALVVAVPAALAAPPLTKKFTDPASGITFSYPAALEVARITTEPAVKDWRRMAALVEPKQLQPGMKLDAVPEGQIPYIDVLEVTGLGARIQCGSIGGADVAQYRRSFGPHEGVKLPGLFGPEGDQGRMWLARIGKDRCVMVFAHKYYFRDPRHSAKSPVNTPYEEWVDAMLASIVLNPKT